MKKINLQVTASTDIKWKNAKRIIIRTDTGIVIGTVLSKENGRLNIGLDSGTKLEVRAKSPSILGEGLNRKRKTIIPDDELYAWQRNLCADLIGRK